MSHVYMSDREELSELLSLAQKHEHGATAAKVASYRFIEPMYTHV